MLLFILLVWVILHHARPQLKIEIGIRGWVNLTNPKSEVSQEEQPEADSRDGEGDEGPP